MSRRASQRLDGLTSPEAGRRVVAGAVLAVPLGSTEQHGPHLPLSTDTDVAVELARRLAAARADVVVAPAVPYGASGEHAGFAGTLSIGEAALELLVLELGRSATETFDRIVLVSAHGGNAGAVGHAVDRLRYEGRDVRLHQPRWQVDAHAGRTETSMLLALRPDAVSIEHAVPGETRPLAELMPALRSGGVRAVTATGILGDPTGASAAEGERVLAGLASDLVRDVDAWWPGRVDA
ncbi:MAG TPA: mycofactocin biosynthesis peptidyl-dipeptidase MftE [Jatrophihabitans sp.]|uniref:mycofactocin biosynthesis peptidyl-dipeptidase MftE n=1 Tax=Jatrophihabitans sp. TaxID=1932789 RepID=UPI002E078D83|nr:mycofactocin biosynthesis peptidyl-dipeptidase MftE [Jatrophihabitans sp.]